MQFDGSSVRAPACKVFLLGFYHPSGSYPTPTTAGGNNRL